MSETPRQRVERVVAEALEIVLRELLTSDGYDVHPYDVGYFDEDGRLIAVGRDVISNKGAAP